MTYLQGELEKWLFDFPHEDMQLNATPILEHASLSKFFFEIQLDQNDDPNYQSESIL
jgi:hypothetical protein